MNTSIGAHLVEPVERARDLRQTFRINGHVTGEKRFVLSSSGHILGIVNPPVTLPKRHFRVARAESPALADAPGTYVLEH